MPEMFYLCSVGGTRSHTYFAADFTRKTLTYLFIDFPSLAQTRLLNEVTAERPLAPDALIADLCLKGWKNILCHLRSETINFVSEAHLALQNNRGYLQ